MVTVAEILKKFEDLAPPYMKEDWDNVGLLLGDPSKQVHKILVALDPFEAVCHEAADWGAELMVTHHSLIFQPVKSVTTDTATGRSLLFLASRGICAINAHTNLDYAPGGVNDVLARRLELCEVEVVEPTGVDEAGRPYGLLRMGSVPPQSLEAFLGAVKERLGCPGLRYVNGGKPVHRVAVGGGGCAGELYQAVRAGCDTFVTADCKYNQFWDAQDLGLSLIDAGHFYTENPVCAYLAAELQAAFPELTVKISEKHRDCMNFF